MNATSVAREIAGALHRYANDHIPWASGKREVLDAVRGIEQYARLIIEQAIQTAVKSVTKDDICEISGKHVECADPGARYCPCNTCQHYLQRIIATVRAQVHSPECVLAHEPGQGGRCLDKDGRVL